MEEQQFGPVTVIPGENRGRYPHCHSLYVAGAGVLIDPASDRERLKRLKRENGVSQVWLSHWHEDHFMHLDLFHDVPLCIMEPDAPPLADMNALMDAYGVDEEFKEDWRFLFRGTFHFRPRTPDRFLGDGETVDLGTTRARVIATPGHTPGHAAFYFDRPDVLFMGDYDLTRFGPWYGDRDSDIDALIRSADRLRDIPAGIRIASHETGIFGDIPASLWDSYLDVIRIREEKLMNFLESPRTMAEIVDAAIIYGRPRKPRYIYAFGEKAHMKKHLERLMQTGLVIEDNGRFVRCRPMV